MLIKSSPLSCQTTFGRHPLLFHIPFPQLFDFRPKALTLSHFMAKCHFAQMFLSAMPERAIEAQWYFTAVADQTGVSFIGKKTSFRVNVSRRLFKSNVAKEINKALQNDQPTNVVPIYDLGATGNKLQAGIIYSVARIRICCCSRGIVAQFSFSPRRQLIQEFDDISRVAVQGAA
jgi:hypothetical protein